MVTTAEVAHLLHITKAAVRQAADEGRLPCQRAADGSRVFDEADVAAWAERRKGGRRRGQPRRPTAGANLAPVARPTSGPTLSPQLEGQVAHPDAGGVSEAQVDPGLGGAKPEGVNMELAVLRPDHPWDGEKFAAAYRLLDRARTDPRDVFGQLVALWPSALSVGQVEAFGDRAKRRARAHDSDPSCGRSAGECLTCLGFGGRPFWAAHVRDLPDRWVIDANLFASPVGKMLVACERCPGPAITPAQMPDDVCPACDGSGVAPSWVAVALLSGAFNVDLATPWNWGPSVCRLCAGWGRLAPMLEDAGPL